MHPFLLLYTNTELPEQVSFHHVSFPLEFYLFSCLCDQGAEVLKLGVGSELCFSLKMWCVSLV